MCCLYSVVQTKLFGGIIERMNKNAKSDLNQTKSTVRVRVWTWISPGRRSHVGGSVGMNNDRDTVLFEEGENIRDGRSEEVKLWSPNDATCSVIAPYDSSMIIESPNIWTVREDLLYPRWQRWQDCAVGICGPSRKKPQIRCQIATDHFPRFVVALLWTTIWWQSCVKNQIRSGIGFCSYDFVGFVDSMPSGATTMKQQSPFPTTNSPPIAQPAWHVAWRFPSHSWAGCRWNKRDQSKPLQGHMGVGAWLNRLIE